MVLPIMSVWRINKREFGKISEKDLTVKDFSCPEVLGGVARCVTVGGTFEFQLRLILILTITECYIVKLFS